MNPSLPDPVEVGRVLATSNDWRAILVFSMFLFVAQLVFIGWREFGLARLAKAIDKVSDALWSLRLTIVEDRAAGLKEQAAAQHARELADAERDRVLEREIRVADATAQEHKLAAAERARHREERLRLLDRETELLVTNTTERAEQSVERVKQDRERKDQGVERLDQGEERMEQRKERKRAAERKNDG